MIKPILLLFLSVGIISGCANRKNTQNNQADIDQSPATSSSSSSSSDTLPTQCSLAFLSALQGQTMDAGCMADVELTKVIAPEAVKGKSDKEIRNDMLNPLHQRFNENIVKLQSNAKAANVDLQSLAISRINLPPAEDNGLRPRPFVLYLSVDGVEEYEIGLTTVNYNGRWYLFEILNTTNVFD